jgi:hypothetical protein
VIDEVLNVVGFAHAKTYYKKFLLAMPSNFELHVPGKKEVFHCEEVFLSRTKDDQFTEVVRKTGNNDSYVYHYEVRKHEGEQVTMTQLQISGLEFTERKDAMHPDYRELKKVKQRFMFNKQYWAVETVVNVDNQPSFLRCETTKESG